MRPRSTAVGVVGLGNILMGDDGVGVRVVQRLQAMDLGREVEVIDGGVGSLSIPFYRYKGIVLVDAVVSSHPPGTVLTYGREEILQGGIDLLKLSLHGMGFSEVLSLLEMREEAPEEVLLVGIVPKEVKVGIEISPEVERAIPLAIDRVLHLAEEMLLRFG